MSFEAQTTHTYTHYPPGNFLLDTDYTGYPVEVEYTANWDREWYGEDGDGRRGEWRTVLVDIEVDPAFEFLRPALEAHACQGF